MRRFLKEEPALHKCAILQDLQDYNQRREAGASGEQRGDAHVASPPIEECGRVGLPKQLCHGVYTSKPKPENESNEYTPTGLITRRT